MKTNLPNTLLSTYEGQRANEILRKCVHCGFCNATCPTYQITGDELDGPRGRIYLIKEMLEGSNTSHDTVNHLDKCLSCLNCETTCPSGVNYGELIEIGRDIADKKTTRDWLYQIKRRLACYIFPYPNRFKPFYFFASLLGLLPKAKNYTKPSKTNITESSKVILLDGCVQSVTSPEINHALTNILNQLDIKSISLKETQCCGAIHQHNGMPEKATDIIKHNIDQWWPHIENGCSAIVMTASGCGHTVKDYARLLKHDDNYAEKALRISQLTQDASEFLTQFEFNKKDNAYNKVAFHPPCTLQHGQKINNVVEKILQDAGYLCTDFKDKHLCCGSAGTYSFMQPEMSKLLKENKIKHIMQSRPDVIASANIGCLLHLQKSAEVPVIHWLDLIEVTKA